MALTVHDLDGRAIVLQLAEITVVGKMHIGGRQCTRIELLSGTDLVVKEQAPVLTALLAEMRQLPRRRVPSDFADWLGSFRESVLFTD